MAGNIRKSVFLRTGPRFNASCVPISLSSDVAFPWVSEIRYLGVLIVRSRLLKCSLNQAKNSFIAQAILFLEK